MPRIPVSLAGVLTGSALSGTALAAIRLGGNFWVGAFSLVTMVLLLLSVLWAKYAKRTARPFWFGFAIFGGVTYLLAVADPLAPVLSIVAGDNIRANTMITRVILSLVPYVRADFDDVRKLDQSTVNAFKIAHSLVVLAAATAGGMVMTLMRARRSRGEGTGKTIAKRAGMIGLLTLTVGTIIAPAVASALKTPPQFFPGPDDEGEDALDEFEVEWYSKHLGAMRAPSLWTLSRTGPGAVVYRFLELPGFDHPFGISVTKTQTGATLRLIVLSGRGGYAPGEIGFDRTVALSPEQWDEFEHLIVDRTFWSLDTEDKGPDAPSGNDGTRYIFEGVRDGAYHVVFRDEVYANSELYKLREYLIGLTGVNPAQSDPVYRTRG